MEIVIIFLLVTIIVCIIANKSRKDIVIITIGILGKLLVLTIRTEKRDSEAHRTPRNHNPSPFT